MRGEGKYGGRYYYDWQKDPSRSVEPPSLRAGFRGRNFYISWAEQANAESYDIIWNTKSQKCHEFVPLAMGVKGNYYTVPGHLASGTMKF